MPRLDDVTPIDDVAVTARIQDGKIEMEASDTTQLRLSAPEHTPLSTVERHATLFASTEDTRVELTLDGEGLDALADAIAAAKESNDVDV